MEWGATISTHAKLIDLEREWHVVADYDSKSCIGLYCPSTKESITVEYYEWERAKVERKIQWDYDHPEEFTTIKNTKVKKRWFDF